MPTAHTLYCDEAGNTGPNYVNDQQPVFVTAGYLVPDDRAAEVREVVSGVLARVNARAQHPVGELKSQALLRSGRTRPVAADLLDLMAEAGAVPFLSAYDKHFALGARYVDDFLDFGTNPLASKSFTYDTASKRQAATVIGQLPTAVLEVVEAALRQPSRPTRVAAVSAVRDALRARGAFGFATIVEGALLDPDGLEPMAGGAHSFPDPVQALTPNVAGFVAVTVGAEQYAVSHDLPSLRLIHDESPNARDITHGHHVLSDPEAYAHLAAGGLMPPRVTRALTPPEFVRSITEPLVQAADVLAGSVADWARTGIRASREGQPPEYDTAALRMARHTLDVFLSEHVPGGGMVFSDEDRWLFTLAEQAGGEALRERLREHRGHPPGYPDVDDLLPF